MLYVNFYWIKLKFLWGFFEQGCNIWREKDKNICQLKAHVNQKPHERNRRLCDYFGINKISSAKRSDKETAVS